MKQNIFVVLLLYFSFLATPNKATIQWFGLVGLGYGISTILGYLMPNTLDTYILNIYMFCKCCTPYIMDSSSSINTCQQSVRGS